MLAGLVEALRSAPSWQRKTEIGVLSQGVVPRTAKVGGVPVALGDDAAAIPDLWGDGSRGGYWLLASEQIQPELVDADPYLAGRVAVLANVNDIYAMGGRPLALVDTILSRDTTAAAEVARGLVDGCERYGVALVGGHLTANGPSAAVSASILGRARRLLSGSGARAGDFLVHVANLNGSFHPRLAYWSCSSHLSARELRGDLEVLPGLAENGLCAAARDISTCGLLGSTLMLLELSRVGAVVDLEAVPRPPEAADRLLDWLLAAPSYGFVLAVAPHRVDWVRRAFGDRGVSCAVFGEVDCSRRLTVRLENEQSELWNLAEEPFTGFAAPSGESEDAR